VAFDYEALVYINCSQFACTALVACHKRVSHLCSPSLNCRWLKVRTVSNICPCGRHHRYQLAAAQGRRGTVAALAQRLTASR
jgi:hypothetical protein